MPKDLTQAEAVAFFDDLIEENAVLAAFAANMAKQADGRADRETKRIAILFYRRQAATWRASEEKHSRYVAALIFFKGLLP